MPEVWVRRWYGVTAGEIPVSSSPRYPITDVSSANASSSTSCSVATAVNSLVIDAESKRVSTVAGMLQVRLAYPNASSNSS